MREKSSARIKMHSESALPVVLLGLLVLSPAVVIGSIHSSTTSAAESTPATPTADMDTCQCGVFLLGLETLVFSADAKPILSGMPVAANCSAKDDKLQCAAICRRLIETMSQSTEDSPLVQTVVLAATKTLACQRFNESERVPLPRNIDGGATHQAKLDGSTNNWKFLMGSQRPAARSDLTAENEMNEDETSLGRITKPKYLGGFYRWCDEHWIYAGISLHEPLCCLQHLPKKCPEAPTSSRNGRRPRQMNFKCDKNSCAPVEPKKAESERQARLIIRRCKNNDCSSEEQEPELQTLPEMSSEDQSTTSSKAPPTVQSHAEDEDDTEATADNKEDTDNEDGNTDEFDTLNPFDSPPEPVKTKKKLNGTVLAEAFQFVNSLMESVGYGEVVSGIASVLPSSTATDLLERIDVGGWMTDYQDRYLTYPREFGLGYCYLEYSMYNVANNGISNTANEVLSRLFRTNPLEDVTGRNPAMGPQPYGQQGTAITPTDVLSGIPSRIPYAPGPPDMNNYISPMPMPENSFTGFAQPGNRRVKRGVTVSRSYAGASNPQPESLNQNNDMSVRGSSSSSSGTRRAVRRKYIPRARNAANVSPNTPVHLISSPYEGTATTAASTPIVATTTSAPFVNPSNASSFTQTLQNFHQSSSFIPTGGQASSKSHFYPFEQSQQSQQNVPDYNRFYQQQPQQQQSQYQQPQRFQSSQPSSAYNNFQQQPSPLQRSHLGQHQQQQLNPQILTEYARPRRQGVPVAQKRMTPQEGKAKEGGGSGAASLMNIANLLVNTAVAANSGGGGGGGGGGDQVANVLTNVLPLVSQVANSPMIHGLVENLVTKFLTPPTSKPRPPPPSPSSPSNAVDDDDEAYNADDSAEPDRPTKSKPPNNIFDSSEEPIDEPAASSSVSKPTTSSPGGSSPGEGLNGMLSQMINMYIKYIVGGGGDGPSKRPGTGGNNNKPPPRNDVVTPEKPEGGGSKDIVDTISDVAKPFFMSYFGIVPGEPGYGKMAVYKRPDNSRIGVDGVLLPGDDPDPGVGILDIFFPTSQFPDSGNPLYNFGNRVSYAFGRANNPQEGLYCSKQYMVNKLWDYFRKGVKAVFKK